MEIKIYEDYAAMSDAASDMILEVIRKKPNALLCFATGDTPKLTYQELVQKILVQRVDVSAISIIGLDEWQNIPPKNPGSCHYFLHEYLSDPLKLDASQVHLFDALSTTPELECEKMNAFIDAKGGIDLMLVGVGMNGHVGFNEPGASLNARAHLAQLEDITKAIGQKYFAEKADIEKGYTLGFAQVMEAGTLIVAANGSRKASVMKLAVQGEVTNEFPVSLARNHKNAYLVIDQEAATEINH